MKIQTDETNIAAITKTLDFFLPNVDDGIAVVGVITGTKVDSFAIIFDEKLQEAGLCTYKGDIFALRKGINSPDRAIGWAEQMMAVLGVKR